MSVKHLSCLIQKPDPAIVKSIFQKDPEQVKATAAAHNEVKMF